jgi:hypothetical protein
MDRWINIDKPSPSFQTISYPEIAFRGIENLFRKSKCGVIRVSERMDTLRRALYEGAFDCRQTHDNGLVVRQ